MNQPTMNQMNMNEALLPNWWILALRGVVAIIFGLLAVMWPGITLLTLILLFAIYAMLWGVIWTVGAIQNRKTDDHWWVLLMGGLFSIGAGVIALLHPGLTALVLILLIGANALVTGALDIVIAARLRRQIRGEWLLVLSGIVSIVFGAIVFLYPLGAGAFAVIWLVSIYATFTGVLLLALAFRVRAWTRPTPPQETPSMP